MKLYALFSPSGKVIRRTIAGTINGAALASHRFLADGSRQWIRAGDPPDSFFHAKRQDRGWVIHELEVTRGKRAE